MRGMPCVEVRERIVAFLDGEIAGEECWVIRRHLEACLPCEQLAGVEQGFKRALGERLRRESAPQTLAGRVRRALAQEEMPSRWPVAGLAGWRLGLTAAAGTAAVLFAALWLGGLTGGASVPGARRDASQETAAAGPAAGALALAPVHLRGTIVCAPCDRHSYPIEGQKLCEAYGHQNGVRDEQGRVWSLADRQGEAPPADLLLRDGRLRGRTVVVDGQAIETLSYLIPASAELL